MAEGTRMKMIEDSIKHLNQRFELQNHQMELRSQRSEAQFNQIQQFMMKFGRQHEEQVKVNQKNEDRWTEFVEQMRELRSRVDAISPSASETQAPGENESTAGILGAGEKDREIRNPVSHESPSLNLRGVSPAPLKNKFDESRDVARNALIKGASIEDINQEVTPTANLAPLPLRSALTALVPLNSSRNAPDPSTLLMSHASVVLGIGSKEQKFAKFSFVSIKPSQGYSDPTNSWGIGIREGQEINVDTPRQELKSEFKNSEVVACPLMVLVMKEPKEMGDINHCYVNGVHGMEYRNEIFGLFLDLKLLRNSLKSFPFDGGGVVAHLVEVKVDGRPTTVDAIRDTIATVGKLFQFVNSCCWCGAERMGLYRTSDCILTFDPGAEGSAFRNMRQRMGVVIRHCC